MMRSPKLSNNKTVLSLLMSTLFLSVLSATGCAFAPFTIPPGVEKKADAWGVRVFLGGLNATLTQTVHPNDENIEFVLLSKGAWRTWEWPPFAQATRYRFNLYARDGKHLCGIKEFKTWDNANPWWRPWSSSSVAKEACALTASNLDYYLKPPLSFILEFRYEDNDRENEMVPEMTIDTSYYIVSDSIMCDKIDPDSHKCTEYSKPKAN